MTLAVAQPVYDSALHRALEDLSLEPSSANRALLASRPPKGSPTSPWKLGHGKLPRQLGRTQVLVRNTVVGLTPFDWQSVVYGFGLDGTAEVQGRDGAGAVISTGEDVEGFNERHRVSPLLHVCTSHHRG